MNLKIILIISGSIIGMTGFFNYNFYQEHNFGMQGLSIHLFLASILACMYIYHCYKERKLVNLNDLK